MKELKRSYGFTRDRAERISLNTRNAYLKKYSSEEREKREYQRLKEKYEHNN